MSETKKQQVKIGDRWYDLVRFVDLSDIAEQMRRSARNATFGIYYRGGDDKTVDMHWQNDRPEVRDTPELPKQVFVDVFENGELHAHRTDPGERTHGSAVRITRRYVLDGDGPQRIAHGAPAPADGVVIYQISTDGGWDTSPVVQVHRNGWFGDCWFMAAPPDTRK